MISALSELDPIVRCIEAGADDYLAKPFDPTLLRARVGASLERKRLHDQVLAQSADLAAQAADLAAWNEFSSSEWPISWARSSGRDE